MFCAGLFLILQEQSSFLGIWKQLTIPPKKSNVFITEPWENKYIRQRSFMRLNANEINSGTAHRRHYAWFQLKYWYAGIFLILLNIFVV